MSLVKQLDNLFSNDILLENIEKKKPFLMQQIINGLKKGKIKTSGNYKIRPDTTLEDHIFNWISNHDPSQVDSKGKKSDYVNYILSWLLDGSIIFPEDTSKVNAAIDKIIKIKNNNPKRLQEILKNNQGKLTLKDLNSIKADEIELNDYEQKLLKDYSELENVWENGPYKIYKIKQFIEAEGMTDKYCEGERVHKFFAFTKWCVRCEETFNQYFEDESTGDILPFYMVLNNNKREALLHFGTAQAKDINDDSVDISLLHKLKPFLNDHIQEINFSESGELSDALNHNIFDADLLLNSFEKNGLPRDDYEGYEAKDVIETLLTAYFKQKPISERMVNFALKYSAKTLFEFYSKNGITITNDMVEYLESLNAEELSEYVTLLSESEITDTMWEKLLKDDETFSDTLKQFRSYSLLILPKRIKEYLFKFLKKNVYVRNIVGYIGNIVKHSNTKELQEEFDERIVKYLIELMKELRKDRMDYEEEIVARILREYLVKITSEYKNYSKLPYAKEIHDILMPFYGKEFKEKGFTGQEGLKEALNRMFYK